MLLRLGEVFGLVVYVELLLRSFVVEQFVFANWTLFLSFWEIILLGVGVIDVLVFWVLSVGVVDGGFGGVGITGTIVYIDVQLFISAFFDGIRFIANNFDALLSFFLLVDLE